MEYAEQLYPQYSHSHPGPLPLHDHTHDHFPAHLLASYYLHPQHHQQQHQQQQQQEVLHVYDAMGQPASAMGQMPLPAKPNETKPRLTKDEVDILEAEFKKNPKPTTQTKRQFAEDMQVDLPRINNWFQNRRAKSKHEKRQAALEAGQLMNQEALPCSEPSSPDFFAGNAYLGENPMPSVQHAATFPMMSAPAPPATAYHLQYTDPSTASMQPLHRRMSAAEAATHDPEYQATYAGDKSADASRDEVVLSRSSIEDQQDFQSNVGDLYQFDAGNAYAYAPNLEQNFYGALPLATTETVPAQAQPRPYPAALYETYATTLDAAPPGAPGLTNFPSQLLPPGAPAGPSVSSHAGGESQSPEERTATRATIDFRYDTVEADNSSPPAPSLPFRSPPPPTDLAARRKKVHVKPAHLVPETLKSRPAAGPRTISHADNFRRPSSDSPVLSPMRRIVSAGGNRNVISGRIAKSGVESAQRSPINLGGFADAGAFLEHNQHSFRYPSMTAGSSLNSSLAPPTPMSPRDGPMHLGRSDGSRSTASPSESGMSLVFNPHGMSGCFPGMEGDQNLASPPETPQAHLLFQPANHWGLDLPEKPWNYDVPDEPLHTPGFDTFQLEMHMPQPHYLSSLSQPVTPAFGQHFNPNFMFGHESPQFEPEAPQFAAQMPAAEYAFHEAQTQAPLATVAEDSPLSTKPKTFQFSHSTPADYVEK